ncbi:T6SS effector BTH_I2691 family protein [Xanthomonas oryzae]|uniref:T6SS effector BTH_I2691 family protein n=1 Tax=Xanthomonas oryzae TaxID=347 RepID=UPI001F4CE8C3|nr:T6SS effector BTH_I2691 family protein [Xanthomonas oryzae]UNE64546.1 hypothetical protein MML47_10960 [Xanthomonas oryzae]
MAERNYAQSKGGTIAPLLPGVADPALQHLGYVMRPLRGGYVYAYYEKPHTPEIIAQKGWQAFQVDSAGYLTPFPISQIPIPGQAPVFACQRSAGYASAMLFVIPDAKSTKRVWVGYSDTPWSEKVRTNYAKQETLRNQRMACIDGPSAACSRSIGLNQANVAKAVADYDVDAQAAFRALDGTPYRRERNSDNPGGKPSLFPRPEAAKDILAQAQAICTSGKQFQIDQALIVSVPDAIGVTHEAAALRLTLPMKAKSMLGTSDGYWKLQSAMSIKAMVEILRAQYANLGDLPGMAGDPNTYMSRADFDARKANGTLPPGATFTPYTITASAGGMFGGGAFMNPGMGTVSIPADQQPAEQIQKKVGNGYKTFLSNYEQSCTEDSALLAKIEVDYGAWLNSAARKLVTEHDFDETTREDGVYYAQVVSKVTYGGAITDVAAHWYQAFMGDDPNEKNNILVRALLGNQKDFFQWFEELDQRSKTIDEIKGLLDLIEELEEKHQGSAVTGALARQLPMLRALATMWSSCLIPVASAAGLMLSKLKLTSPTLLKKLEWVIARISIVSVSSGDIKVTRVSATQQQAITYLRELARGGQAEDVNKSSQRVGQSDVVSVTRAGSLGIDVSGGRGDIRVDVFVFERVQAGITTAALTQLPENLQELKRFARKVGEVLREGGAVISAGSGWLQVLALEDALKKLETGNDQDTFEGGMGLITAVLGSAAAAIEISTAFAAKWVEKAALLGLKIIAGAASALAAGFDAVVSASKALSRMAKDDYLAAASYGAQTLFYFAATGTGSLAVLYLAGFISTAGFGLSWTGWGILLIGLGLAAGYVAQLLQSAPAEEWAARTIWGGASDKWGSLTREQEAMNKLLLGIEVDFSYRNGVGSSLLRSLTSSQMGTMGIGMKMQEEDNDIYYREAWLSLKIPKVLRERLDWTVQIYGFSNDGANNLLFERSSHPTPASGVIKDGLRHEGPVVKQDDGETLIISAELNISKYKNASATVEVHTKAGEVLVSERLP